MNVRRSILGFATTLAVSAGCSSNDAPGPDAGGPGSAVGDTGAETGGDGSPATAAEGGRDASGAAPDASLDGSGQDAMTPLPTDAGADGTASVADASGTPADGSGVAPSADGAALLVCGPFADGGAGLPDASALPSATTSFFVSSQTNATGNLGGLVAADVRCQTLATAVGLGSKTWHAYLSVEHDASNGNNPTNARDRIGAGPWYNSRGVLVAANVSSLHARTGDPAVFLDEHGNMINGQWTGSPTPLQHDILTGTNADGTLAAGKTCLDWTSSQPAATGAADGGELSVARVGHTDGLGPLCSTATSPNNVTSWSSAHDNAGCNDTAPRGGAGRILLFRDPVTRKLKAQHRAPRPRCLSHLKGDLRRVRVRPLSRGSSRAPPRGDGPKTPPGLPRADEARPLAPAALDAFPA